jgi:hypothetical protein
MTAGGLITAGLGRTGVRFAVLAAGFGVTSIRPSMMSRASARTVCGLAVHARLRGHRRLALPCEPGPQRQAPNLATG